MKWQSAKLQTRLYLVATIIFIIGISSSLFIYFSAGDLDTENPFGNQLDESKSYRRSLELYGGKANLLATQFTQWFSGLWQGKSLGFTIACITGVLCLGILLVAHNLPSDSE